MQTEADNPHLTFPDIGNRESLFLSVIPDILYRESILVFFRMDPRHKLRG